MAMYQLSDEAFARQFFAELDLSNAKYAAVRTELQGCKFTSALNAWKQTLIPAAARIPSMGTMSAMSAPGDVSSLMAATPTPSADLTFPPKALLNAVWFKATKQTPEVPYAEADLVRRWAWYARRFINDSRTATYWQKAPNQASEQLMSYLWPFLNLPYISPKAFDEGLDARIAAEYVYFALKWPLRKFSDNRYLKQPFPMNQRANTLFQLQVSLTPLADFADAKTYQAVLNEDLPKLYGTSAPPGSPEAQAYYDPMGTDIGPDGIGSENSYNYAVGITLPILRNIANFAAVMDPPPPWLDHVKNRIAVATEAYRHFGTPGGGVLILAKNGRSEGRLGQYKPGSVPEPNFLSEQFPYHGVFIMRENWTPQSLFLALSNVRRGSGHEAEDANKLTVEAYGQYMLVSNSGERDCCDANKTGSYFGSSWAQNTVNVDDVGMKRVNAPRHAAYIEPTNSTWQSNTQFDQVGSTYDYGWGGYAPGSPPTGKQVDDVKFTRNVVYLKALKLWVVVDRLNAPADASHDYRQVWNFHSSYARASFGTSINTTGIGTAGTAQANKANMLIYHLPVYGTIEQPLAYDSYFGAGCTASNDSGLVFALRDLDLNSRGCMNMGTAYGAYAMDHDNRVLPAPTVHARWRGKGPQVLVSVLAPSPSDTPVVASLSRTEDTAAASVYKLTLRSGQTADIKINKSFAEELVSIRADGVSTPISVKR